MQAKEHDGKRRDEHGGTRAWRIVNERRDWRREHEHDDECREANEIRYAHGGCRLIVDALRVLQGSRLRNRRHDAHRQGRREDCREIDERHRHAREIAEQFRRLRHRIARDLKTLRHDQKVEVRHDRQHDARRRHGQGE